MDKTRRPSDQHRQTKRQPEKITLRHERPAGEASKPAKVSRSHQSAEKLPKAAFAHPNTAMAGGKSPAQFRRPSAELCVLYGTHAVRAALQAKRREILSLFATPPVAERLAQDFTAAGMIPQIVSNDDLARRLGAQAVHQGVMIEARPLEMIDLSDIVSRSGIILALDQITDPHNVGAIVRTAAAFNVDAIVTTERHSPELSGVMAKAASGGLEFVPIALIGNFARALERLAGLGYLRVGLDSQAPSSLEDTPLSRPLALVLGGEGKGLRRLSRENCDVLARLDMAGPIKSLNVSNACAVALTLASRKLGTV